MNAPLYPFACCDVEVYADRYEDLEALFAELAEEEGDDELPPIIVLEPEPDDDPFWPVAATAGSPVTRAERRKSRGTLGEGT